MEKNQKDYQKINPILRWIMILSLIVVFFTLLISWLLWFLFYRNVIDSILVSFSFLAFSIIILIFAGLALFFALPLIVLKRKTIANNIFSLLSFVLALILASVSLLLYHNLEINNFLVVVIPWIIIIIATTFLFVSSGVNLIIVTDDSNKIEKISILMKKELNNQNLENNNKQDIKSVATDAINNKQKIKTETLNELAPFDAEQEEDITFADITIVKEQTDFWSKKSENNTTEKVVDEEQKWTEKQIKEVWEKGEIIPGVNKDLYRKDYAGAWMFFSAFLAESDQNNFDIRSYSWTIANHNPTSQEKINDIANLMPMNLINAMAKGQNYPKWKTKISSWGNENIIKEQIWSD
ncbi:NADH-quinone oxidoreductase subunit J [Spiroplasma platyhelix]|uniref:Uncharacterized protein n=1 Tax=Spiroplasma platyhelix PALS-1 TaxID=1276218 RepID=A0A846U8L8_9MOLU|nr:NADH-quinone oxidoreductase subunit J [Spiroplasma platyhelix]MBE4703850.1 hypothetical protein [Spiroplasma platyhelix PALS-1]NKE38223.1 hypothetical protein [Spiroplasma platyhelix PALS-1]UJB29108.1 hypothetical protein SPLAT_v1c03440 [Spiroplasma platyhelix PALS-1]